MRITRLSVLILTTGLILAGCATTQPNNLASAEDRAERLAQVRSDRDEAWSAQYRVQARANIGERAVRQSDERAGSQ